MLLYFVLACAGSVVALNNGVGKLPVMGYDTYNAFGWYVRLDTDSSVALN